MFLTSDTTPAHHPTPHPSAGAPGDDEEAGMTKQTTKEQESSDLGRTLSELRDGADEWMSKVKEKAGAVQARTSDEWDALRVRLERQRRDLDAKLETARRTSGPALRAAREDLKRAFHDFEDAARALVRSARS